MPSAPYVVLERTARSEAGASPYVLAEPGYFVARGRPAQGMWTPMNPERVINVGSSREVPKASISEDTESKNGSWEGITMEYMRNLFARRTDEGASAVEYGLLVAGIAALIVVV